MFSKSVVIILAFTVCTIDAFSQGKVKGKVFDSYSKTPLPFASAYINGTTLGVYANEKGEFEISRIPVGRYELLVSFAGYDVDRTIIQIRDSTQLEFTLNLKPKTLKTVEIVGKRVRNWDEDFDKFQTFFLGKGDAAKLCKIINPHVIEFSRDKDGTFLAKSDEPIEVENLFLGYKVYYDLELLTYNLRRFTCTGNVKFEEIATTDTLIAKRWTKNRRYAYAGSINHFLKTVISNTDIESGYATYSDLTNIKGIERVGRFTRDLNQTIGVYKMGDKIRKTADSSAFLIKMPRRLEIQYQRKYVAPKVYIDINNPVSWIEMKDNKDLVVNHDGSILNPDQMTLLGNMLEARVAQMLPSNYHADLAKVLYRPALAFKPGQLNNFAEKPYVQTDRSYYYPGETIWFRSYMMYAMPGYRDSLSRVLHVDIVDENNSTVAYKAYEINKGLSIGDITLNNNLRGGDYTLRAYTRWMLNFDSAFVFKKAIKILNLNETVRSGNYNYTDTTGIGISTNKVEYNTREAIDLTIMPVDEYGDYLRSTLAISVTDLSQANPAPNEMGIMDGYHLPEVAMNTLDKDKFLAIQKGFDLTGSFVSGKRHILGELIFIEGTFEKTFTVTTKKDGSFFFPDLLLYDTARLSYIAKVPKGLYGTISYDTTHLTPLAHHSDPLQLQIDRSASRKLVYVSDVEKGSTILKSVTITGDRVSDSRKPITVSDHTIDGDWIRNKNPSDILYAIQTKVPGMRIMMGTDRDGAPIRLIYFSGSNDQPLVLIDGVILSDMIVSLADQISALPPDMIESVDITLYGMGALYGMRGGNGVIAITTRKPGNHDLSITPESYDLRRKLPLRLKGFSTPSRFSSPDYSDSEGSKDLPDNRTTLYWNPSIESDGRKPVSLRFYAADLPTKYRIVVEGVTSDGRPIRGEKIIVVKK